MLRDNIKTNFFSQLQIIGQVKQQLIKETLRPGDELPSVRELADNLDINMHTVRRAYLELRDQGIVSLRLGRRARIVQKQPLLNAVESDIKEKFEKIIDEALLAGLSPEGLRHLVNEQLDQLKKADF